jgi:hypothetical protein
MKKGKAFFVVGHKSWGKSDTLEALTDDNYHFRYWTIKSQKFFVRRTSDDDNPASYRDFVNNLAPASTPYVLAALCPRLTEKKWRSLLLDVLDTMKRKYELYFFVLRNKGNNPEIAIPNDEIAPLERFGAVKIYRIAGATPEVRAQALEKFVKLHT